MPKNTRNSNSDGSGYDGSGSGSGSGSESGSDHSLTHTPYGPVSYSSANVTYTSQPVTYDPNAYAQFPHTQTTYDPTAYAQTPHTQTAYDPDAYAQTPHTHAQSSYSQDPYDQGSHTQGSGVRHAGTSQGKRSRGKRQETKEQRARRKAAEGTARPPKDVVNKAMHRARFGHITNTEATKSIIGKRDGLRVAHAGKGGSGDALKKANPNNRDLRDLGDNFNKDSLGKSYLNKGETVPEFYGQLQVKAGNTPVYLDAYKSQQERDAAIVSDSADGRSTDASQEGHIKGAYHTHLDTPIENLMQRTSLNDPEPALYGALRSGQPVPSGVTSSVTTYYPPESINRAPDRVEDDMRSVAGQPRQGHSSSSGQRTSSSSDSHKPAKKRAGHERAPTRSGPSNSKSTHKHSRSHS